MSKLFILCLLFIWPALIAAFPTGAPYLVCSSMRPFHGAVAQAGQGGYQVVTHDLCDGYQPRRQYKVTLFGKRPFKGFLCRAFTFLGDDVGLFLASGLPPNTKLSDCTFDGSGVTHSTRLSGVKQLSFTWLSPALNTGSIFFRCTVVESYRTFYVDIRTPSIREKPSNVRSSVCAPPVINTEPKPVGAVAASCPQTCPAGPRGTKGQKGEIGRRGLAGRSGQSGSPGRPGPKGDPGDEQSLSWSIARALGTGLYRGARGDRGNRGDPGFLGQKGGVGIDSSFRGRTGIRGPSGSKGFRGQKGYPGDLGEPGDLGFSSFGPKGFVGDPGVPGPEGPPGLPGSFEGNPISAVEVESISRSSVNTLTRNVEKFEQQINLICPTRPCRNFTRELSQAKATQEQLERTRSTLAREVEKLTKQVHQRSLQISGQKDWCEQCNVPLGMSQSSRVIRNNQISANSQRPRRLAQHARLGHSSAWVPRRNKDSWLQVDFGQVVNITAIGTQGLTTSTFSVWTKDYLVKYRNAGSTWQHVLRPGGTDPRICWGNKDGTSIERCELTDCSQPLRARYIRIEPQAWKTRVSLRTEFYGCR